MTIFPPIADYAFLSDCEVSTLVAPDGSVEWLCLPAPRLAEPVRRAARPGAGFFRFGPSTTTVPDQRRYVPGTKVLETTWHTPTGWLTVGDLLVIGPPDTDERREGYRRVPGDDRPRRARCSASRPASADGSRCRSTASRSSTTAAAPARGATTATATTGSPSRHGDLSLELASSIRLGTVGARSYGRTTLEATASRRSSRSRGAATPPTTVDEAIEQLATDRDASGATG